MYTHKLNNQYTNIIIEYMHNYAIYCVPEPSLTHSYLSGDLPYRNIPLSSIVAQIVAGYRLPTPEYASEDM